MTSEFYHEHVNGCLSLRSTSLAMQTEHCGRETICFGTCCSCKMGDLNGRRDLSFLPNVEARQRV